MASFAVNAASLAPCAIKRTSLARTSRVAALKPKAVPAGGRKSFVCKAASVGLFFSTTTGNTEEVADLLSNEIDTSDPTDIGDIADDLSSMLDYDCLLVGAPTWNTGADENRSGTSWDDCLADLAGMDFSGKKVAVFGCGDSSSYTDYFCDAIEEVYSTFKGAGAEMVGAFPCDDYDFECSKSCVGGPQSSEDASQMLGLAIDVENQADLTEDRVSAWATQLKGEMKL